jgi:hypothetical protein
MCGYTIIMLFSDPSRLRLRFVIYRVHREPYAVIAGPQVGLK